MPGIAPGKEITGIPIGDESAKERVIALLGGSVAEDTYTVSNCLSSFLLYCIGRSILSSVRKFP